MIDARDGGLLPAMERVRLLMSVVVIVADIDPDSPNFEYWSSLQEGVFSCSGSGLVSSTYPTGIGGGVLYNVAIIGAGSRQEKCWTVLVS